jgi:hypothetical protein
MQGNKFSKVTIIVLNWNGWNDTLECLESLTQISYPNYQIIVVDNGSTDGSAGKIRQWAAGKANIEIIELKENIGYAKGNNVGIRRALSFNDVLYVLILNNDTVVEKDFLAPLVEVFGKYNKVGLVGPKILDHATGLQKQGPIPKRIDFLTIVMFFTPLKWLFLKTPIIKRYLIKASGSKQVYSIVGCCLLFSRDALKDIGLFDENTFLGWEECIIAEKLLRCGYQTYVEPKSVIYHKYGQSTGRMESAERTIAFLESEAYFQENYLKLPKSQRLIIKIVRFIIYSIIALVNLSYSKNYKKLVRAIFK